MANIFNVDRINNVIVMGTTGTTTRFPFLTANRMTYLNGERDITSITDLTGWVSGTVNQITATDDGDGTLTLSLPNPLAIPGKLTAGSFGSPLDVTNTRQYGFELHYSGDDYDVTGLRSRAQLITTDTTATAQGALIQATNNDDVNAGCLNGCLIEAIGKATTNAATISMMRGCLVNTEWSAKDTITDLRVLHVRTHTRDTATEGYVSGTGYGVYIENEAVGGNGQALDAGIYLKGTNLSAGNKAYTYGLDFSGATYGTAEIKLSNGETIDNLTNGQVAINGSPLQRFVSRGDPASYDFDINDFITDGNWHEDGLDLSSIIPVGTEWVYLKAKVTGDNSDISVEFRKNDWNNTITAMNIRVQLADTRIYNTDFVQIGADRKIAYRLAGAITYCNVAVVGWVTKVW